MNGFNKYLFMPCFSLDSTQLSLYNKVFIKNSETGILKGLQDFKKPRIINHKNVVHNNLVVSKHHNFRISDNAYRSIKRKINWLHYLAKPKHVKTYNGKDIFNFKCAFITLTLPSIQKECTQIVTNQYFNQFLTEIRQRTKMSNYVWRLEFQKNGNVHYHIITDTYLDYFFVRSIWNRILSKGAYISDYQNRFINLNLSEYRNIIDIDKKLDYKEVSRRFALGKKHNWTQPNSVDVKSVISNQSISNYLSKYFSKDSKSDTKCNILDNEENSKNLRLWFCSRSLSKLKSLADFVEAVDFSATALISEFKSLRKVVHRYCTTYYFDITKECDYYKKELALLLKKYSIDCNYVPN